MPTTAQTKPNTPLPVENPTNKEIIIMLLECGQDEDQMDSIYRVRQFLATALENQKRELAEKINTLVPSEGN